MTSTLGKSAKILEKVFLQILRFGNKFEFTLFCLRDFKIIVKALKVAFLMKWKVATLIWQGSNIGTKSMQNTSAYEEPR